jgi:chromosomal replication initiation ATPase DnaA
MNIHPYIFAGLESAQILKPSELLSKAAKIICQSRGITEQELMSTSRTHAIVMCRHEFIYLARTKTDFSLNFIGKVLLNNKNHATVLHSAKTFKNILETDANVRAHHMRNMAQLNFVTI